MESNYGILIGFNKFRKVFWSPSFWLAPRTKWSDLRPGHNGISYTNYSDLYTYPLILVFVILIFRYFMERYIFTRLGLSVGIKNIKLKKPPSIPLLENTYQTKQKWKHKEIAGLAKQLDMSERQVQRWIRLRKYQEKPSTLIKFCEHSWRCFYYTNIFIYGLITLYDKPWFWNIDYCWINYPHQGITDDVWWYYMLSLGFYWSLTVSQFSDVKRKDFWYMFVHHLTTISLLSFSWICNLHRIGSLVLIIHDATDFILDAGKCAKYAKFDRACTRIFIIFLIMWIITKMIIFPFWILRSTTLDAPRIAKQMFPAYYFFNGLLCLLLIIHLYWTCLIFKLAYRTWSAGKVERDIRSSNSENSDSKARSSSSQKKKE